MRRFQQDAQDGALPGSEPPALAGRRAAAALRGLAARHDGATVLVVAHNTLLRMGLCTLLGIPVGRYRRVLPRLDNAAVTEIEVAGDDTALLALNVPTGSEERGTPAEAEARDAAASAAGGGLGRPREARGDGTD